MLYCPKASRKERDAGLEDMPMKVAPLGDDRPSGQSMSRLDGRPSRKMANSHPTVKPLKLTQWLSALLLPPEEYAPRRILVPFAGSGSEMIGAGLAGWEEVIGIEMEKEYIEIAEARLKYWTQLPKQIALDFQGGSGL